MKRVLVNGAGGFIGGHMVKRLKAEGHWVRAVDLKHHEYTNPSGRRVYHRRPSGSAGCG